MTIQKPLPPANLKMSNFRIFEGCLSNRVGRKSTVSFENLDFLGETEDLQTSPQGVLFLSLNSFSQRHYSEKKARRTH